MKSPISKLLLVSAFALTVHAKAATISQTATGISLPVYAEIGYGDFEAFDSALGTLNSVTFYVDSVSISGSVEFIQGNSGNYSTIRGFSSDITVQAGYAGSGFYNGISADQYTNSQSLTVTGSMPVQVAKNNSATFNLTNGQYIVSSPISFDVTTGDFVGTGKAPYFYLVNNFSSDQTTSGNTSYMNYGSLTTLANIRLVYDYTAASPVPEPSTYGLGLGALALGAVAIRRRSKAKA